MDYGKRFCNWATYSCNSLLWRRWLVEEFKKLDTRVMEEIKKKEKGKVFNPLLNYFLTETEQT